MFLQPLKTLAFINKEVNRLALQFLEYGAFGSRTCPDLLAITYYAGNYRGNMNKEYTREIQDTYYQLDKDLEQLLDKIDQKVGLQNTLIVFTGSGYYKSERDLSGRDATDERRVPSETVRRPAQYVSDGALRTADQLGHGLL